MGSSGNANWFLDCSLIDDIPDAGADFGAENGRFYWAPQGLDPVSNIRTNFYMKRKVVFEMGRNYGRVSCVDMNSSFLNSGGLKEPGSAKRMRSESSSQPSSKACREKMRRERLNDRFLELSSVLDPGNPPKTDKAAILSDASQLVTQLRNEAQKLKDSNESLQEKIKELKDEKNELRNEKQRLKAEKESLEQQVKLLNAIPSYVPQPPLVPSPFAAQGQAPPGHKLMVPVIGFPGFPMWQYMPPSDVDTSQDADNCPPVA